jgi:hypothetical protein
MEKMTISSLLLTQSPRSIGSRNLGSPSVRSSDLISGRSHRIPSTKSQMEQTNQPHGRCRSAGGVPVSRPPPTIATSGGDDGARASTSARARPDVRRRGVQVAGPATRRNAASEVHIKKRKRSRRKIKTFLPVRARPLMAPAGSTRRASSSRGRRRTRRYGLRRHRDQR